MGWAPPRRKSAEQSEQSKSSAKIRKRIKRRGFYEEYACCAHLCVSGVYLSRGGLDEGEAVHASLAASHQHPAVQAPTPQRVERLVALGLALHLELLGQPIGGRQTFGLGARTGTLGGRAD